MKFYEVIVSYLLQTQDEKGKTKNKTVKEKYLIKASSVTNAEKITKQRVYGDYMDDYKFISARESNIIACIDEDKGSN